MKRVADIWRDWNESCKPLPEDAEKYPGPTLGQLLPWFLLLTAVLMVVKCAFE